MLLTEALERSSTGSQLHHCHYLFLGSYVAKVSMAFVLLICFYFFNLKSGITFCCITEKHSFSRLSSGVINGHSEEHNAINIALNATSSFSNVSFILRIFNLSKNTNSFNQGKLNIKIYIISDFYM